jgi:hypothetical protein
MPEEFAALARDLGYDVRAGQERAFWRGQAGAAARYWHGPGRNAAPQDDRDEKIRTLISSAMNQLTEAARLLSA